MSPDESVLKIVCLIGGQYAAVALMQAGEVEKLKAHVALSMDLELLVSDHVERVTCEELLDQWEDTSE